MNRPTTAISLRCALIAGLLSLLAPLILATGSNFTSAPTAVVKNGTYIGRYLGGQWDQDVFLGIPYAQPPTGSLRFAWPQSLNTTFGQRNATDYGYSCYQYGSNFALSEDCLTLNVIRPRLPINTSTPLPVLVWIYGGGLSSGSTADPQYNLSGIVRTAYEASTPLIAISINYRLGVWGFLQTPEILAEGSSNAGLLDQRLALRWIKENIASFGGDAARITLWGESAGAQSIGLHLHSYDGRNDDLFHAAILESGGPIGTALQPLPYYASPVENLTRTVGCHDAASPLACLRALPISTLFAAQTSTTWNPLVDGDFLTAYPSTLMSTGHFIHVPLLTGTNSDEGISFPVANAIDTDTDLFHALLSFRGYALSPPSARHLLALYPDDPAHEPPYDIPNATRFPSHGLQWRRAAALGGDIVMVSGRRKLASAYAARDLAVYSYRFAQRPWNARASDGVHHFVNVAFSFQNVSGALGPLPAYAPDAQLSRAIGRAYAAFVSRGDPNGEGGGGLPRWPKWTPDDAVNMVLLANGSWIEGDDFRAEGIDFINSVARELLA